jgi:hypothetical protein
VVGKIMEREQPRKKHHPVMEVLGLLAPVLEGQRTILNRRQSSNGRVLLAKAAH